jgi:hypothetical protein
MNVGQTQMNAPFNSAVNYANLIGSMQVPTTTTSQVQTSPLTQAATIANLLQGSGAAGGLGSLLFGSAEVGTPGTAGYKAAGKGLFGSGGLNNLVGGAGTSLWKYINGVGDRAGTYPLEGGGKAVVGSDGNLTITAADGSQQIFDKDQNLISSNSGGSYTDPGTVDNRDVGGTDTTNPDSIVAPQYNEDGSIIEP